MTKKKELTWGDKAKESAKNFFARNYPIPYFIVDEIYSRITGNPSDSNRALYSGVNPLDDQPNMSLRGVGLAISQWTGFLTKWLRRDFDNLDYEIGENDPIGARVAQAAWAKYNRLPYDENLIKDNGDGTFSIPKEITSKIRTEKKDIEEAYNVNKKNLSRIEDEYRDLIKTATDNNDLARAQQLREEKKKDRRIWLYEAALNMDKENLNGIDSLISKGSGVFNMFNVKDRNLHNSFDTDLNVLNNFTIYKDKNGKYRYRDIYDFSPIDVLLNGNVFKIEGDIGESSSPSSSFNDAFRQAKKRGDNTFLWNGKEYSTNLKLNGGVIKRMDKWTIDDEDDFRDWYSQISANLNLNPDPDAPDQYYDYRSFWKENPEEAQKMLNEEEGAHFTDKYKLPGHPTFSEESIYSTEETPGGKWAEHDGAYYYIPSEYTKKYLDRTREYLAGSNEGIELDGKYELIPPMRQGGGMEGCGFCRAWQAARASGESSFSWNGHTFHTEEKRHGGALLEGTGDIWSTSSDVIRMFGDGGLVERQDHVFDRLVNEYKIPPIQAAAIVANLTAESGLDPMAEGDSGQSVGIQQWKGPRRKELEKMSKSGVDIPGLDAQVDFLMKEYNRNAFQFDTTGQNLYASGKTNNSIFDYYQYSKADFDNAKNLWDATIAWNQGVGRPNKKFAANEKRFKIAQEIADRHGIKYDENSHYEMMGPTSLPTLEVFAESSKEKVFPSNQPASPEEQSKMDEFMSHISDMLADYDSPKQDINVYISNSGNADQQLKADDVLTRKRLAEQEQREKEKRFLEAVLPEIQLHIPGMAK